MKLERNEIDSGKETGKSRNHDTLFGNGLASVKHTLSRACFMEYSYCSTERIEEHDNSSYSEFAFNLPFVFPSGQR